MGRLIWKPGTMLYPIPAVLVTCGEYDNRIGTNKSNIITISWIGTICSEPAMVSVSIRPERYSYNIIRRNGEFAINLTTKKLVFATDYCGVKSGRDIDKFQKTKLTPLKASHIKAPLISESPVNIECKVTEVKKLGSHDMFIAKVLCINADEKYINEKGVFNLEDTKPICYCHGHYFCIGKHLGKFGFSVKKK